MSNANIKMSISLDDKASPELKQASEQLKNIEKLAAGASVEIQKLGSAFKSQLADLNQFATKLKEIASNLNPLAKDAGSAATAIGKIGSKAKESEANVSGLASKMGELNNALTPLLTHIKSLVTDLGALRGAATGAGTAIGGVGGHASVANTQLGAHRTQVQGATRDYEEMSRAMVGAMQMWAANKIGGAMKSASIEGADEETAAQRARLLNVSEVDRQRIDREADKLSSTGARGLSKAESVRLITEAYSENGDIDTAIAMAPIMGNGWSLYKKNAKANGVDATETNRKNVGRIMNILGADQDADRAKNIYEMILQTQIGSGDSKVADSMHQALKFIGGNAPGLSDQALRNLAFASSDMFGGSEIGVAARGAIKKVDGIGLTADNIALRKELGMYSDEDKAKIAYNKDGTVNVKRSKANGLGADMYADSFSKDFVGTSLDLLPELANRAKKAGIINDDDQAGIALLVDRLFGGSGGAAVAKLLGNKAAVEKGIKIQQGAATFDQQKEAQDTAADKFDDLKAKLHSLKGVVGELINEALKPVTDWLIKAAIAAKQFAQEYPNLAKFATLAAGFTALSLAIGALTTWMGTAKVAAVGLELISNSLSLLKAPFAWLVSTVSEAAARFPALSFAVLAIAAAFAHWEEISKGLGEAWSAAKEIVSSAIEEILSYAESFSNQMQAFLSDPWGYISDRISEFWGFVKELFNEGVEWVKSLVSDFIDEIGSWFGFENASQSLSEFWDGCKSVWNESISFVSGIVKDFVDFVAQLFGFSDAGQALDAFSGLVGEIWEGIKKVVTSITSSIYDFVKERFSFLIDYANEVVKVYQKAANVVGATMQVLGLKDQNKPSNPGYGTPGLGAATVGGGKNDQDALSKINSIVSETRSKFARKMEQIKNESYYRDFVESQTKAMSGDADWYGLAGPTPRQKTNIPKLNDMEPMGGSVGGSSGRRRGGGGSKVSEEANQAKNEFKAIEDQAKAAIQELDSELKNGLVSYDDYFKRKRELITNSVTEEISALEREKSALQASGNIKGVQNVERQIQSKRAELDAKLKELDNEIAGKKKEKSQFELEIEEKLASVSSNRHDSEIAKLDVEMTKLRDKAKLMNASPEAMAKIDRIEEISKAKIEYAELEKRLKEYGDAADLTGKRVASAAKLGEMTATEAANATTEAYRAEGNAMAELIPELQRYAQIAGDPAMLKNVEEMKIKSHELANQVSEDAKQMRDSMQGNFEGFLNDLSSGKGLKGALKGLADNIVQTINKTLNKQMGEAITNMLFGKQENGKFTGLFGNFFQGIISKDGFNQGGSGGISGLFGGLFGGGSKDGGDGIGGLGKRALEASAALGTMAKDGVVGATQALGENIAKTVAGTSVEATASAALAQLATAAQSAAAALSSMGGGGGMGGGLGGMFGGGMDLGFLGDMGMIASFDVGADQIPRDMIAQIHKDEMILPAETASRVRASLRSSVGGSGGGSVIVNNSFHLSGPTTLQSQQQIASVVGSSLNRAVRRNG